MDWPVAAYATHLPGMFYCYRGIEILISFIFNGKIGKFNINITVRHVHMSDHMTRELGIEQNQHASSPQLSSVSESEPESESKSDSDTVSKSESEFHSEPESVNVNPNPSPSQILKLPRM